MTQNNKCDNDYDVDNNIDRNNACGSRNPDDDDNFHVTFSYDD